MQRRRLATRLFLATAALCAIGVGTSHLRMTIHRANLVAAEYEPAPPGMVFVPPGEFLRGSDSASADHSEGPLRPAFVPGFYIDRHEVTNAQFRGFDSSYSFAADCANWPVTGISRERAEAYATWKGLRLPTALEWEKAARGTDGREYPWGDTFDAKCANLGGKDTLAPVGSYPEGASPYGALDMAGNAWEWTAETYRDDEELGTARIDRNVIRGGGYSYSPLQGRAAYKGFESVGATCNDLGFRCAGDARIRE